MDETVKKQFGEKLGKLIEASGMSRSQFSKKIGHERSVVSTWCNGKSYPKFQNMKKIADALNTTYEELIKVDTQTFGIDAKIKVLEDWIAENKEFEQKFNLEELVDGTEGKKRAEYVEDLILEYRKAVFKAHAAEKVHEYDVEMIDRVKGENVDLNKRLRIACRQTDIKDRYCDLIWCLGVDYDGYETPDGLKSLIDELVALAKRAVKNDDKYAMYEGCGDKYYNILNEEVPAPKEEE